MEQKLKKEKKWWQHLLIIPVMLVIDLLALCAAGMADTASAGDGLGHPAPAFLLIVVLIFGVLTVVLTLRAIFLCVRAIIRTHKGAEQAEPVREQSDALRRKKPVWRCFIPLMVEIPLAIAAVIECGRWEINSFYNDPTHIGFAIPMGTFLLAGICFLVTLAVAILCIIAAVIRSKRNKQAEELRLEMPE